MRLTREELATFCDKSSRDPNVVRIYEQHDYLDAYARHTDLRVAADPEDAIGGLWEAYGHLCSDFLIAEGLQPKHRLLDFGCGTGRLARKIVPYLHAGKYYGVDISRGALRYAKLLGVAEGWNDRIPMFLHASALEDLRPFDYVWAFSVFIHLPPAEVQRAFTRIARLLRPDSRFYFSYVPTPEHKRTGLKQFKHPRGFYSDICEPLGLLIEDVETWEGKQDIACARRAQ